MDKVFSARVDESIVNKIGVLARELHTTRKSIVERAIDLFSKKVEQEQNIDIFDLTYGTWDRKESVQSTVSQARQTFRDSMTRYHV